jgi:hypothetical protein
VAIIAVEKVREMVVAVAANVNFVQSWHVTVVKKFSPLSSTMVYLLLVLAYLPLVMTFQFLTALTAHPAATASLLGEFMLLFSVFSLGLRDIFLVSSCRATQRPRL